MIESMDSRTLCSWDERGKLTQHDQFATYNKQLAIFKRL